MVVGKYPSCNFSAMADVDIALARYYFAYDSTGYDEQNSPISNIVCFDFTFLLSQIFLDNRILCDAGSCNVHSRLSKEIG